MKTERNSCVLQRSVRARKGDHVLGWVAQLDKSTCQFVVATGLSTEAKPLPPSEPGFSTTREALTGSRDVGSSRTDAASAGTASGRMFCGNYINISSAQLKLYIEDPFYIDVTRDIHDLSWNWDGVCVTYARSVHSWYDFVPTGWASFYQSHNIVITGGPNFSNYAQSRTESSHINFLFCDQYLATTNSYRQNEMYADYSGYVNFLWDLEYEGDCWALLTGFYEYWVV